MALYEVKRTRISSPVIQINEEEVDVSTALVLFGRKKLAYGEDMNENLLHLLEAFACPETPDSIRPSPDVSVATGNMFAAPLEGQLWYNNTPTKERLYVWNGTAWTPHSLNGDIAANWGVIASGEQLPLPVSHTGRTYTYAECSWVVTPYGYPNTIDYMVCRTEADSTVKMEYSLETSGAILTGFVNYLIVGIPGNTNLGSMLPE